MPFHSGQPDPRDLGQRDTDNYLNVKSECVHVYLFIFYSNKRCDSPASRQGADGFNGAAVGANKSVGAGLRRVRRAAPLADAGDASSTGFRHINGLVTKSLIAALGPLGRKTMALINK